MKSPPWGTIRIGATDWTIKKDEHGVAHGMLGNAIHKDHVLLLYPNGGHWPTRETALHETLHAIGISLWPAGHDDELTEAQIIGLTTLFLSVIRDNSEFAKWLVEHPTD